MTTAREAKVFVVPSDALLGAEVKGADLSEPLTDETFAVIYDAWLKNQVLVFRNQTLSDEQLVKFGQRFGELHVVPFAEYNRDSANLLPPIDVISNIIVDGKPIGALGAGEAAWHTDMSVFDEPASATLLYGLEIPSEGGNTRFASMYAAYDTLPESVKARVAGRTSIHDIAYNALGQVRKGFDAVTDKTKGPGAVHPVVRTHNETTRKALYLGREGYGYIHGLSVEESDELLALLWSHMTRKEFIWEHQWRAGDLIVWDNRCTIHSRGAFNGNARRLLHRVTVKGGRPV